MKKNNLFKPVGIVILAYVIFSWIVPIIYGIAGWEGEVSNQIGLVSIISVILEAFSGFGSVVLFVLLVGGLYGVLKATGAYEDIMDSLSSKIKGKEQTALLAIIIILALLSSIVGLELGFLVFFPLLIGLIVKMGYDKLVAVAATFGSVMVGMYGSTLAGTTVGHNNTILSLGRFDNIIPRIILLVVGVAALIVLILMYNKNNGLPEVDGERPVKKSAKKTTTKTKTAKAEKVEGKKATGAFVILGLLALALILGTTNFELIFGGNWFAKAHDAWTAWTVNDFPILGKIFGGVDALGSWYTPGRFPIYSLLLIISMIALKFVYKTDKVKVFEGFVDGIKSFIIPAMLTVLAYSVFIFVYYNPTLTPVTTGLLNATKGFNVLLSGLYAIINSVFFVDYYYLAYSVLYGMVEKYSDASIKSILGVMFTSLYSLVMLIAPTSVLLLTTLSISEVKYKDWFKFIWKLLVALFVVAFIVFSIMLLI